MEIQKLKSEIIAKIRSTSAINNVTQCVTELVLNSLDSKSTSIAVRINLVTFKIQVVDNGEGITEKNLELTGLRYMTNKCNNLVHLERHIKYHGFRGEALASIIDISKKVVITSKSINSTETYSKNFGKHTNSQITSVKNRPSYGTTVTVEGFLNNLPIRRKRIVPELELEDVKRSIESLIIMYPNVSFSVRNDLSGDLIINSQKNKDIISSFKCLHPEIEENFSLMKISKNKVTVEALLFKGLFANKHLQYVYVNRRPIHCSKIKKYVSTLFLKNMNFDKKSLNSKVINDKSKYPVYVINIKCPHSHVDILLNPSKTLVEFKNWDIVTRCLEKLVYSFFGNDNKLTTKNKYLTVHEEFKGDCGVSQIYGAFKSYGYKRKLSQTDSTQEKVQKGLCFPNDAIINTVKSDFIQDEVTVENFTPPQKQMNKNNSSSPDQKIQKLYINKAENDENTVKSIDDIYSISDTTPVKKSKVKTFKKPLPIKITHKTTKTENLRDCPKKIVNRYSSMDVSPFVENGKLDNKEISTFKNVPVQPSLKKSAAHRFEDEKSSLSKFTADENKGKNLIMDMFLKSTQVYTEEDNQSDARSEETILEVESNFLLENNVQTNINGLSKTMSVSVNIRSTKKIKKHKPKMNKHKQADKTSKCVQTTLDEHKMVSKYIQTTFDQNFQNNSDQFLHDNLNKVLVDTNCAENYTIALSDNVLPNKTPRFKFVYKNPSLFNLNPVNELTSCNCKCHCHLDTSKIFNFVNSTNRKKQQVTNKNILNCNIETFGSNSYLNKKGISCLGLHHDGKMEGYKNINCTRNVMQTEINQFIQNNGLDNRQSLNNIPYKNNACNKLPKENEHIVKQLFQEDFIRRKKKINNLQSVSNFGYDRSPYFLPTSKHVYPKTNTGNVNRINENKCNVNTKSNPIEEPFFLNLIPNNADSYELFDPRYRSTQLRDFHKNDNLNIKKFVDRDNENLFPTRNVCETDFTIDHFGNFQPVYKSTQRDLTNRFEQQNVYTSLDECDQSRLSPWSNLINVSEDLIPVDNFNTNFADDLRLVYEQNNFIRRLESSELKDDLQQKSGTLPPFADFGNQNDLFESTDVNYSPSKQKSAYDAPEIIKQPSDQSELVITLSNRERQEILRRELNAERDLIKKTYLEWDSQSAVPIAQEDTKQNDFHEFENDWVKTKNNFGSSFYINKRTGFTTFLTPKPNVEQFKFGKRFEFMPKGLSPIMKAVKQVDRSLDQNEKNKLQRYILESHQNELLVVKWQNYIKHNDPKTFFDEVYKEKLRLFEDCIPKINTAGSKKFLSVDEIYFNNTLFDNIDVIGQVDGKFIAVLEKTKSLLLLFDQHAVHERIRLEELLRVYRNSSVKCVERLSFFLPQNDISLLKKHDLYLNSLGLSVEFFMNGINVLQIPSSIYNKFKNNDVYSLNKVIHLLITEIIELLKETRGVTFGNLPKIIQDLVNLEACRGAIKFGDNLQRKSCIDLLNKLAICKLPFQCAHGRPTLMPLLRLNLTQKWIPPKLNLKRISSATI